jgi:hypothetical protein
MWKGGLGIPGGVIGGALALIIYTKSKKLSFWQWADFIAPGLLVGQAIGRWGNFVNQEVYGRPTNLPWAITIDPQYRISGFEQVAKYHPLFLYESLLNLAGAGVLLWIDRKFKDKLFKGDIFFGYMIWYSTVRFLLEFLRLDPSPVNGININQTSMLVVGVIAVAILILRHTVWSGRLAEKELADRERKLALDEQKLIVDEEPLEVEVESLSDDVVVGLPEDLDQAGEEILSDLDEEEILEGSIEIDEEDEDWVADALPEEPEEWVEDHLPEVDPEDVPDLEDEYFDDEAEDEDPDKA